MALNVPEGMDSNGTMLVLYVPAISNTAAPTIAELTAGSVVDLSCYLTADGFNTSTQENSVEDTRLCTKQVFESPGDFTQSLELTYVYNTLSVDDDKARATLVPGNNGHIVARYGLDPEDAISVGDVVDVFTFIAGKRRKNTVARNTKHNMTQKMFLQDVTRDDVTVVA